MRAAVGLRDQVDGLGGAAHEDDFLRSAAFRNFCTVSRARVVLFGGVLGEKMHAAMNIGVVALVVAGDRVDHRLRLLRGRGVVQIDQRLAVHLLPQDREIARESFPRRSAARQRVRCAGCAHEPLAFWRRWSSHFLHTSSGAFADALARANPPRTSRASNRCALISVFHVRRAPALPSCGPGIRWRRPAAAGAARKLRRCRASADKKARSLRSGRWSRRACTSRRRRRFPAAAWCRSAR